jgi:hypothetical protein
MAKLTEQGRIRLAAEVHKLPIYMAWGEGDPKWEGQDLNGTVDVKATELVKPVGILKATETSFVTPTNKGEKVEIDVDSGTFKRSPENGETLTKHLYLKFQFDFDHAEGKVIREMGVYVGKALDEVKLYADLPHAKLDKLGDLMLLEHRRPIYRDEGVRETFEFVITF